ncbi:MAG: 50S ribosomal protein L15 [Myxococcales bacterium]|nr:50S ribosomal protein L15 [Myxococcales bacterium]
MAILSRLKPNPGAKQKAARVGRGPGSGLGKTAGRGQKGQKARASGIKPGFEGGQTPLARRLPKVGFKNIFAPTVVNVNVGELDAFAAGADVTLEALRQKRLVQGRFDLVKILGDGELTKGLTVHAHAFSAGAKAKIVGAGGTVQLISLPKPRIARDRRSEEAAG